MPIRNTPYIGSPRAEGWSISGFLVAVGGLPTFSRPLVADLAKSMDEYPNIEPGHEFEGYN